MEIGELVKEVSNRNVMDTMESFYRELHLNAKPTANHQVFVNRNVFALKISKYKDKKMFPEESTTFDGLKEINNKEYNSVLDCMLDVINDPNIPINYVCV